MWNETIKRPCWFLNCTDSLNSNFITNNNRLNLFFFLLDQLTLTDSKVEISCIINLYGMFFSLFVECPKDKSMIGSALVLRV